MNEPFTVVDLFSGAGGMSYGFHANPAFTLVGAVDAQLGKPSSGRGTLQCNGSYTANTGVVPLELDLSATEASTLHQALLPALKGRSLTVLIACPPCTGFSRANPANHITDDPRNSLVRRCAGFVKEFKPQVFLMENARELLMGRFSHHFQAFAADLAELGYHVEGKVHRLDRFGLPQQRERALVVACRTDYIPRTIEDLWEGFAVLREATHVRRAISWLPPVGAGEAHPDDPLHVSPRLSDPNTRQRLSLIPKDGGSWADLRFIPGGDAVMTPAMLRYIEAGDFGSHPDVYGRMWWDRPAATIKRECGHTGNGRYAHPEQDRLCTVREMAILQGFPADYRFEATGLSNMYRHIGDAVPPLIAFQLSRVCEWVLTGRRPGLAESLLPNTHLTVDDLLPTREPSPGRQLQFVLG